MKNRKLKLKSVFFTMAMAFGMLLPVTASAQSDGFFRGGGDYSNRDAGGGAYSLNNQTFGQETAPLGTGLLILTAAGAGYVALKRKKY